MLLESLTFPRILVSNKFHEVGPVICMGRRPTDGLMSRSLSEPTSPVQEPQHND